MLAQVGHNGGQSSSRYSGVAVTAPSPVPDPMFREVPRALTPADLDDLVAGFARTAEHVVAGGYDGVEVQASQASVIRQFLSPPTNHRDDGHGDDPARLLVEILAAVRAVLGPGRVLGVRLQGDEGIAGGLTAADAASVARRVVGLVDYVSTAVGVATVTLPLIEPPMGVPAGYAAAVPTAVRAALRRCRRPASRWSGWGASPSRRRWRRPSRPGRATWSGWCGGRSRTRGSRRRCSPAAGCGAASGATRSASPRSGTTGASAAW